MRLVQEGHAVRHARNGSEARGFTLIEILIVVIILGIMAAIVVPAFNTYGRTARQASLTSTIRTLRSQIQAYRLQHGDELPDLAAASAAGNHFQPLLEVTTYGVPPVNRGPYLASVPLNTMTNGAVVKNVVTFNANGLPDPVPGADFIYDLTGITGAIWGTSDTATGVPIPQD
jgi:prepilin-type N-terminal cleavage/methylation domain-containing protein